MSITKIAVILIGVLATASSVAAQERTETGAILLEAASYVHDDVKEDRDFRPGPVKLEAKSSATATALKGVRDQAEARNLEVVPSGSVLTCPGRGPLGCRLRNATVLLWLEHPEVNDDTATVLVDARYETGQDRQPVGMKVYRVELVRDASGWRAVSARVIMVS
jgi:hypothetical protein